MKWVFSLEDGNSPLFLWMLKHLDAISTFVAINTPFVYEMNKHAVSLWSKLGFWQTHLIYSTIIYFIGVSLLKWYKSNWKFSKPLSQFCYNVYILTLLFIPLWNYYISFSTWFYWVR